MTKKPAPQDTEVHNTLLGDLESIRALLEIPPPPARGEVDDGTEVPMLDDMVEGALTVSEGVLTSRVSFADDTPGGRVGLADDTIKALLGDAWRSRTQQILGDARATMMHAQGESWAKQHVDAVGEALRARIDQTVDEWLARTLSTRIDELRTTLVEMLETELTRLTDALTDEDDHAE